jgi:hypothetical protein
MDQTTKPRDPVCRKCRRPMMFHSFQTAHDKRGERTMQVFECKACERLAARPAPTMIQAA